MSVRRWLTLTVFVSTLTYAQSNQLKLDFKRGTKPKSTAVIKDRSPRVESIELPSLDERPVSELKDAVQSFSVLINTVTNQEEKSSMQINRGYAHLAIAQKILKSGTRSGQQQAKSFLASADRDALTALIELRKINSSNRTLQSRAYYMLGVSQNYQGNMSKASENFQNSLRLDPQSSWALMITLAVAEQNFIDRNFNVALSSYEKILRSENPAHRLMAMYRIGWIYLNLKRPSEALNWFEKSFNESIKQKSNMSKDIFLDMVFISSRHLKEMSQ